MIHVLPLFLAVSNPRRDQKQSRSLFQTPGRLLVYLFALLLLLGSVRTHLHLKQLCLTDPLPNIDGLLVDVLLLFLLLGQANIPDLSKLPHHLNLQHCHLVKHPMQKLYFPNALVCVHFVSFGSSHRFQLLIVTHGVQNRLDLFL